MGKAVVLSAGGPVGIGWMTGLRFGLATKGVDLTSAEAVLGTSAGALVGARLALADDPFERIARYRREATGRRQSSPIERRERRGNMVAVLRSLTAALAEANAAGGPPEAIRARLGTFALESRTAPEKRFLAGFAELADRAWPAGFTCTAVDALSGALVVWDQSSGVALDRAVAASCALPGLYPPITLDGRRYIDGGMRSSTNADLVVDHERAVVVTVTAPAPPGTRKPNRLPLAAAVDLELATLQHAGAEVEVIGPGEEFLTISGEGVHLMDQSRVADAVEAGIRQGEEEAVRIQPFWDR